MQVSFWIIDRRLENGPVMLPVARPIEETGHSFESTTLNPILTAMVYCIRENDVLLLRRAKEPMKGLWVAPGGKIEPGESPWQCANRELQEETGLQANGLMLRGIVTETSPRPDWQWLIFIYVAQETSGQMIMRSVEGELAWVPASRMTDMPLPEADHIFGPRVLDLEAPRYHAHFVFDEAKVLQSVLECPSQVLG